MKQVIGLGTGRCGTSSLSEWLGVPHETKPYPVLNKGNSQYIKRISATGDVSFANLAILGQIPEEWTVLCLMREPDATIKSILRHPTKSYFERWYGKPLDTYKRVAEYYDWYYSTALEYNIVVITPDIIPIRINRNASLRKNI